MTTKDEALKQALDALGRVAGDDLQRWKKVADPGSIAWHVLRAIATCREALAQKDEQEPVLWKWALHSDPTHIGYYTEHPSKYGVDMSSEKYEWTPLYTAPPKRQPLTDEGINEIAESMPGGLAGFMKGWGWQQFARAIEAAHGIWGQQ